MSGDSPINGAPAAPRPIPRSGRRDAAARAAADWMAVCVRGRKCLQRHVLMFNSTCLSSWASERDEDDDEDCEDEVVLCVSVCVSAAASPCLSVGCVCAAVSASVCVCEVLAECSGERSGSDVESSLWNTLSRSEEARSNCTLKTQRERRMSETLLSESMSIHVLNTSSNTNVCIAQA